MPAARGRKPGFYVYRIFDGYETVYVGKGSGRRLQSQMRKFGMDGHILEECGSDDDAFARERHWIARLMPTANKCPGGNGGRAKPRKETAADRAYRKFVKVLEEVGSRKYVARFLLTRLSLSNCEALGVSKVDLFRLQEVANGPRH